MLSALKAAGVKQKEIAKILNKSESAISQEINRNGCDNKRGYDARIANQRTRDRRVIANQRFRKIENSPWLRRYIVRNIKKGWSPEQIAGRIKRKWPHLPERHIGKDSIYEYIYTERKDLVKYLRCKKGKYRRRRGTRIREKQREEAKKKRIDERPDIVDERQRIGDWEGDTIVGKEKTIHILTHVDRKSGLLLADKLDRATAEAAKQKTIDRFRRISSDRKHTITYDNGIQFSEHELTARKTGIDIYFAYPYHSWERATNENTNGLLREYFPKGSSFAKITEKQIKKAVNLINNRPRKRHGFLTPKEVFYRKNSDLD